MPFCLDTIKTIFRRGSITISRDRFRTAVNVLGDSYGAGLVEHLSKGDLKDFVYLDESGDPTKMNHDPSLEEFQTGLNARFNDKRDLKQIEAEREGYDNANFSTSL